MFVHYLTGLQNNPDHMASLGRQTSWDECVRAFDVEKFADRMREAGAGYVIFTMMQRSRFLIAPNATFDRLTGYRPGEACATRDLVEDLYQALNRRGIALMLYWTGDVRLAAESLPVALRIGLSILAGAAAYGIGLRAVAPKLSRRALALAVASLGHTLRPGSADRTGLGDAGSPWKG